jgi:hypothetical protein
MAGLVPAIHVFGAATRFCRKAVLYSAEEQLETRQIRPDTGEEWTMAHVRKGQLTAIKEWRKHLRFWKKFFWHAERREARRQVKEEAREETKARPPRRAFDLCGAPLPNPSWPGLSRPSTSSFAWRLK